jgi:hypothetical protein
MHDHALEQGFVLGVTPKGVLMGCFWGMDLATFHVDSRTKERSSSMVMFAA